MKHPSLFIRACVGLCLIGLALTAQAAWRTKYVVPNQSADVIAPAPVPGASALLVSVKLAHELNGPSGRYCSPEVDIFNASSKILKVLVLRIDFFQKTSGENSVFVGSTVTRAHYLPPHTLKRETFYVLDTDNCKALSGVARVQLCDTGGASDCTVGFSGAGRVPLRPGPPDASDRLNFSAPHQAGSLSAPGPAAR